MATEREVMGFLSRMRKGELLTRNELKFIPNVLFMDRECLDRGEKSRRTRYGADVQVSREQLRKDWEEYHRQMYAIEQKEIAARFANAAPASCARGGADDARFKSSLDALERAIVSAARKRTDAGRDGLNVPGAYIEADAPEPCQEDDEDTRDALEAITRIHGKGAVK